MSTSATKKKLMHILIAAIIFAVIAILLPAGNGLTDKGVLTVALFAATIYCWIFVGVDWPSLLAPGALIALGVMSQVEMLAVSFGNMCFAYVLVTMLINVVLEDTGVIEKIATWFITRPFCKGRPWMFMFMFMFSIVTLELFLDCVPVTLIYVALADRICQKLGYEKGSKFGKCLIFAVLVLVIIPYGATPISHPGAILIMGFMQGIGLELTAGQFMALGVPFSYIAMLVVLFIFKFVVRPDFSNFENFDPESLKGEDKPLSKKAKIATLIFVLVVFCWLAPDIFKGFAPAVAALFKQWGVVAAPTLAVAAMAIIHIDGKPMISVAKDIHRIPLGTLIFIVGVQSFANTLTHANTGVSVWLGNIFAPFAQTIPASLVIVVTLLMTVVMTQFLSNIVVINLIWAAFSPVLLALNAAGGNYNLAAWGVVLCLVANVAFMFPSASVVAPPNFTSGYLTNGDAIKYGLPVVVIMYIVGLVAYFAAGAIM